MDFIYHRISLDIHTAKSQATLKVKQGDTSRKLLITLCENGLPYHIADDCYADFSAVKADGNYLFNDCTISGNTIEYTFTAQTSAAVGAMACEITLYGKDGQRITSPRFTIIVEETVYNGEEIVSSPEANALNELIDRAEHAVDNAESFVDGFNFRVNNTFANAVKGKVRGNVVRSDDVSPVEHIVGCKVKSKNLYNNLLDYVKTSETTWVYENGTLQVDCYYVNKYIDLEEERTYTLSYSSTKTGGNGGGVYLRAYKDNKAEYHILNLNAYITSESVTFTMPKGYHLLRITFYGDTAPSTYSATYSNIMLEEGSVATGYIPFLDVGGVSVTRYGKNLIPYPYYQTSSSASGGTITVLDDGSLAFSGTPTAYVGIPIYKGKALVTSGNMTLSNTGTAKNYIAIIYMYNEAGDLVVTKSTTGKPLTLNMDDFPTVTDWNITYARAISNEDISGIIYPMLEIGSEATDYEAYSATTHSVNADGTVNGITSLSPTISIISDTDDVVIVCEYNRDSNEVLKEVLKFIDQGGTTPAVARIVDIFLSADAWVEKDEYYSQVVSVEGATSRSQVDLTPSVEQLAIFHDKDLAFVTENVGGVVTVYAIGQKPTNDYTMQATVTEVNV